MDKTKHGVCRLCLKEAKLSRSHIIPEFCFSTMYDENHRFIEVANVREGITRKGQKGYTERLLCAECETYFNRFERHTRRLFVDPLPARKTGSNRERNFLNLSYTNTKLFFLSILWRSSVSTHETFKHVDLGPHEEPLRQMLLNGDAGTCQQFGVMVLTLHFDKQHFRDLIVEPTYMRIDGRRCYRFVFMGFIVLIFVSNQRLPRKTEQAVLSPERPVTCYDAELNELQFLREVWQKAAETTHWAPLYRC